MCFYVEASLHRLCMSSFWYKGWFWFGCQTRLSSGHAGCYHLVRGCSWCCRIQSLGRVLDRISFLLSGCHCPARRWVYSLVVWVEVLKFGFSQGPLTLSVYPAPKDLLLKLERPLWSQRTCVLPMQAFDSAQKQARTMLCISPCVHPQSQFSSVAQSGPTLCDPMDCSTPGFPVHHQLPELTQTHVH